MASGAITAYSQAVTPQEGWFIAGEETFHDRDYWIIDNKKNLDPWYVDFEGGFVYQDFTIDAYSSSSNLKILPYSNYGWRGFSDWAWCVDNDWLLRIQLSSASISSDGKAFTDLTASKSINLYAFDLSAVPAFSSGYTKTNIKVGSSTVDYVQEAFIPSTRVFPFFKNNFHGVSIYGDNLNKVLHVPISSFTGTLFWNVDDIDNGRSVDLDGCNINDLYIFVAPGVSTTYSGYSTARAHMALSFMVPKDKCPAGLAIGDYWPKLRPLEVEIANGLEGIEQDYYMAMLQQSQINDPSKVSSMKKDLSGKLDAALGMPNIDTDLNTDAISGMMDILGPLKQIFPWLIAGLFVIVLIRRGVT